MLCLYEKKSENKEKNGKIMRDASGQNKEMKQFVKSKPIREVWPFERVDYCTHGIENTA